MVLMYVRTVDNDIDAGHDRDDYDEDWYKDCTFTTSSHKYTIDTTPTPLPLPLPLHLLAMPWG